MARREFIVASRKDEMACVMGPGQRPAKLYTQPGRSVQKAGFMPAMFDILD